MANIKKNLVYNFLLSISQVLIPLVSIPYLSRVLQPEGIGRVGFIDSFTWYFIAVAEFGIAVYGTRTIAAMQADPAARGKLVSELLGLHFITSSITLVIYAVAAFLCWREIHDTRLLLISLTFLLTNFFACEWYFRGMEDFGFIAIRSLITRVGGLIAIFLLVKQPADYHIYYAIIVSTTVTNNAWNVYKLFRSVPISFRGLSFHTHLRSTRIIYFISITYSVTYLLDNVLLGLAGTAAAVGLYSVSARIVRMATNLITDSMQVFFPRIAALAGEGKKADTLQITARNLQMITFFVIPLSAGLFLIAGQLVAVMFGSQYTPAIADIQILAVYPCLKAYNLFLGNQVLIAHHQEKAYLKSLTISSILFLILSPVLSWLYADLGACLALLAAELITVSLNVSAVKRLFNRSVYLPEMKGLLSCLLISSLFIPVVWLMEHTPMDNLPKLITSIGCCCLLYFGIQLGINNHQVAITARQWIQKFMNKPNA